MPSRFNRKAEIGTYHNASDSNDMDNVFLTEKGWVYRHYKSEDFSRYWDEVLVPGDVPDAVVEGTSNAPLSDFMDADDKIHFENTDGEGNLTTDGQPDITYSPDFAGQPKVFTPLGSIEVVLTHNFPDAGNTIHDHEVGAFHAEVTFKPADDHPLATLDDVEDGLEFHWTHDGIHNDGDDIVGRDGEDVSYKFDSVGHHVVSVVVTGDNISNSGTAGDTDEFEVYGHIDSLSIDYQKKKPDDTWMRPDLTDLSKVITVSYEGSLEGPVTVTKVEFIDETDFVQEDWYTLELNDDNTFVFNPEFAYGGELEITVDHENLSEPYTERVPIETRITQMATKIIVPDLPSTLGGMNPGERSDWWMQPDLRYYGNNRESLKYIEGYGGTDPLKIDAEIINFGSETEGKVPADRVYITDFYPSAYPPNFNDDGEVYGHNNPGFVKSRSVGVRWYADTPYAATSTGHVGPAEIVRCHAVSPANYTSSVKYTIRAGGVDGSNIGDGGRPKIVLHEDDNPNLNWVGGYDIQDRDRLNRKIVLPSSVKEFILVMSGNNKADNIGSGWSLVMHNKDWTQVCRDSKYLPEEDRIKSPLTANQTMKVNIEAMRIDGFKNVRFSVLNIIYNGAPIEDQWWKRIDTDESLYLVLI